MSAKNLGLIFGQTLIYTPNIPMMFQMNCWEYESRTIELMILFYNKIFVKWHHQPKKTNDIKFKFATINVFLFKLNVVEIRSHSWSKVSQNALHSTLSLLSLLALRHWKVSTCTHSLLMLVRKTPMWSSVASYCRITDHPELERTHEDHQVQLLVPHSTNQNSEPVSESTVQMLLELWQLGAMSTALGSLFHATALWWRIFS